MHSSGPGGQHVNKTSTAVELRVDVRLLALRNDAERRLRQRQANRINKEGVLVIQATTHRSQLKNRQDAIVRVEEMVAEAKKATKSAHCHATDTFGETSTRRAKEKACQH